MIRLRILILLALAGATFSSQYCNDIDMRPFYRIGQKFYWIELSQKVNWYEAAHACRALGGHLASIESDEEMKAISDHLLHKGTTKDDWFWISGNDLAKEGEFLSLRTGKKLDYVHWSPGQPDNAGSNENCVHLWQQVDGTFFMNDWICKSQAHYICQANDLRTVRFLDS